MGRKARIKEAHRAEREELAKRRQRGKARQTRRWLLVAGAVAATFAAVLGATFAFRGDGSNSQSAAAVNRNRALAGQAIPILGRAHVPEGTKVTYNSNPPTSGNHWPRPADWGVYRRALPDEQLVHNLEHGGIWISYKGVDAATRARLEALAREYPQAVILTPRPQNDAEIALASWGRLEKPNSFDRSRIVAFISANINKSPEPLAQLAQVGPRVGAFFPDFRLTEAGTGQALTRATLRGKPAIIWFTTSYCVPCQIGASRVAPLDDEFGGKAFKVLVVFVDPRDPPSALINWRNQFGRPDWQAALDQNLALAKTVGLRFLDTKFLLDPSGIIKNIDFNIADERYLDRIRQAVKEARRGGSGG